MPELWASDGGQIAVLKHVGGGGFNVLPPRMDQFGELFVMVPVERRKNGTKKFVSGLVLVAFGHERPGARRAGYRDGDSTNCHLSNLAWMPRGETRVIDLVKKKCLGKNCGAMFMSEGAGHRLCPACANHISKVTTSDFEGTEEASALPDEPLCGTGGNPHR